MTLSSESQLIPKTLHMERMTWPEVEQAVAAGYTRIIVPSGAVEQHGWHLPLATDSFHAVALAEAVALELGNTLVSPGVFVGCSDHHMEFTGTLSLRRSTFEAMHLDICQSLAAHGFKEILLITGHGGNFPVIEEFLPRLNSQVGGATVHGYTDLMALLARWTQVAEEASGTGHRVGGHADIAETSVMLAIQPELVTLEDARPGVIAEPDSGLIEKIWSGGMRVVSPTGVLGDPEGASASIGRECVELVTRDMAHYFESRMNSTTRGEN